MGDNTNRNIYGKRAGIVGIITNIFLFIIKVTVGIISGSIAVVADAINNLSDAGSSIFLFVGYHLSEKPADKEHPYGHARMEHLSGLFISLIVTVLGIELLRDSIGGFFEDKSFASFSLISIIVMSATILFKGALALYYAKVAKKIDSQSLRASAFDSLGDIFATLAVIIGMILTPYTGPYTDSVLGCIIALYIIALGLKLTKESSDILIGKAPDDELIDEIVDRICGYDGVLGIHDLVIHSYGAGKIFASVHVEVDGEGNIMEAHDLIDNIENDMREGGTLELVIHMDPVQRSDPRINSLREQIAVIVSDIAAAHNSHASIHDFRAVFGITHSNLIFDIAITDDLPISDLRLCGEVTEKIRAIDPTYNCVITVDRDYTTNRFGERL